MSEHMQIGCITQLTDNGVEQTTMDGFGVSVRFANLREQQFNDAVRAKLIDLGWTPPGTKRAGLLCINSGKAVVVERHDFIPMLGYRNVWIIDAEPTA